MNQRLLIPITVSALLLAGVVFTQETKKSGDSKSASTSGAPAEKPKTAELSLPPLVSPSSALIPETRELERELRTRMEAFFATLKAGKVEQAYQSLLVGSKMGQEPEIMAQFYEKTHEILRLHGPVEDVELIKVRQVGKHLREITYQLSCVEHPTSWRIFAYHGGGKWKILDLQVRSELARMAE